MTTTDPHRASGRASTPGQTTVVEPPKARPVPAAAVGRYRPPSFRTEPVRSPSFRETSRWRAALAAARTAWVTPPEPEDTARRFDPFAVAALTTALLWLFLPAIVLGHVARRRVRTTGAGGDGLAVMALVIGYAILVLALVAFVVTELHGGLPAV